MGALAWSIIATVIISLMSLAGIVTLAIQKKILNRILILLVGFSAGALMGGAFFHLIPEAAEKSSIEFVSMWVVIGFMLFFLIERILHWRHCHKGVCDVHTFTHMNLIGDGVHNFIDGLIIAASFSMDFRLGLVTTIAVASHELPQEIGDFGVLVHGGFTRAKALLFNFLTAITSVVGAFIGIIFAKSVENFTMILIPFAAGGFIYIFASDLIPELHKEPKLVKSLLSFGFFVLGVAFMIVTKLIFEG